MYKLRSWMIISQFSQSLFGNKPTHSTERIKMSETMQSRAKYFYPIHQVYDVTERPSVILWWRANATLRRLSVHDSLLRSVFIRLSRSYMNATRLSGKMKVTTFIPSQSSLHETWPTVSFHLWRANTIFMHQSWCPFLGFGSLTRSRLFFLPGQLFKISRLLMF